MTEHNGPLVGNSVRLLVELLWYVAEERKRDGGAFSFFGTYRHNLKNNSHYDGGLDDC